MKGDEGKEGKGGKGLRQTPRENNFLGEFGANPSLPSLSLKRT